MPVESKVDTDVSPVTSNDESRVTASSTFKVPFTVVIAPLVAISTAPPLVASEVAPVESKVDTDVSPVTSSDPAIFVLPVEYSISNVVEPLLLVLTCISPNVSIPILLVASKAALEFNIIHIHLI